MGRLPVVGLEHGFGTVGVVGSDEQTGTWQAAFLPAAPQAAAWLPSTSSGSLPATQPTELVWLTRTADGVLLPVMPTTGDAGAKLTVLMGPPPPD